MPAGHADAASLAAAPIAPAAAAPAVASNALSPASLAALHARARSTAPPPPPAEAEIVDAAAAPDAAVVAAALSSQLTGPSRRRCALAVNVPVEVYASARRQLSPLLEATDADGSKTYALQYQARARTLLLRRVGPGGAKSAKLPGTLAVICCGGAAEAAAANAAGNAAATADLAAAEAARAVAEHLGCYVLAASAAPGASVDVAAARRALGPALEAADAVVVVAGDVDPALPAVVAALTDAPVVALPTSAAGAAAAAASPGVVAVGVSQSAAAAASAVRVLRVAATRVGRMLAVQQQKTA
jgi:NCAIR mutase (PurE)-related protein